MSWEALSTIGSLIAAPVLAAAAVAAVIQIRHLRAGNQLEGFLAISREIESPELLSARAFVEMDLPQKLNEDSYREELRNGRFDLLKHPEVRIANFWEKMGALIRHGVLDAPIFLDFFGHRCALRWRQLAPVAELVRQNDPLIWREFEYLAGVCERYVAQRQHGGSW
jgi:hypothetical protein